MLIRAKNSVSFKCVNTTHGFTLMEVLLAMAIMACVLSPIFITQGTLLQSVGKISRKMARIFSAKQYLYETRFTHQLQEQKDTPVITIEKKFDHPETLLTYEIVDVPKNSLFAEFSDIYIERVKARWKEDNKSGQVTLVGFIFKPKPSKKKGA